jgi:hypothetical protein
MDRGRPPSRNGTTTVPPKQGLPSDALAPPPLEASPGAAWNGAVFITPAIPIASTTVPAGAL